MRFKKIFTNVRIIILLLALVFAVIAINPDPGREGVAIRTVGRNSSASDAGMVNPRPGDKPMFREVIFEMNGRAVKELSDYESIIRELEPGDELRIRTHAHYVHQGERRSFSFFSREMTYLLTVRPLYRTTVLNETEEVIVERTVQENMTVGNMTLPVNKTINVTETRNKVLQEVIGTEDIGLKVYDAPTTNINKGLDLQGGTRVLLQPEERVSADDIEIVMENLEQRLNVFGLSDIVVRRVSDLTGNNFVLVEVAGANEQEVRDLIARQGKFEAKIGNETAFIGGNDIRFVCRSADCAYAVSPRRPCAPGGDGLYYCTFEFGITLSTDAAQRLADLTRDLQPIQDETNGYLDKSLDLYLDDELVDSLRISADLRGKPATEISISGPGVGQSQQEAVFDSARNMKQLQTLLVTGSLPVKLDVVKIDTVSPTLGEEFLRNVMFVGVLAIVAVTLIVSFRYMDYKISAPMVVTLFSEIVLLLGLASLIGWNLDLAAIAGILVAVGTGVDDQIIIVDEIKQRLSSALVNWKERLKRAFFIIMAAYATTVVAMLPLWWAGAGLVRGFAITTILGVTFGVFITRPAFAALVEILSKD